jgi:hypothetical protein
LATFIGAGLVILAALVVLIQVPLAHRVKDDGKHEAIPKNRFFVFAYLGPLLLFFCGLGLITSAAGLDSFHIDAWLALLDIVSPLVALSSIGFWLALTFTMKPMRLPRPPEPELPIAIAFERTR